MPPEETVAKSPLDKPLSQLTEDDISQLTREDCRRYLKQKGMRRPSWNKSQAIQQVISLKTLLETSDSDASNTGKKLYIPRPRCDTLNNNVKNDNPLNNASKATSADEEISESAEEMLSHPRKDAEKADVSSLAPVEDNDSPPPRLGLEPLISHGGNPSSLALVSSVARIGAMGSSNMPVGQMTIFYCGRVNVYDDVPLDKAQELMHFAASPLALPQKVLFDSSLPVQSRCPLKDTSVKSFPESAVLLLPNMQSVKMTETTRLHGEELSEDNPAEAPASRKALVQRYREKRKDRFKGKRKVEMTSITGLDIYLNHQMGHHIPNELSSGSDPCPPQPIWPPKTPIRCNSMEDHLARNAKFSSGDRE